MCVILMGEVWKRRDLDTHEKFVLLSIADHCNSSGLGYPSVDGLAARCAMSDRGVQKALKRLSERGFVTVARKGGPGGRNLYSVSLPGELSPTTPNPVHPNGVHPEPGSPRTGFTPIPNPVHPHPEPGSPKPSIQLEVRKKEPPTPKPEPDVLMALSEVMSPETAQAFIDHRKAKNAKLTMRAAVLVAAKLRGNPRADEIVETSIMNGWTGVFPNSNQSSTARNGGRNGQSSRQQFDIAHREYCRRLSAGEIHRGPDPSDPFAQ